jgi:hypothetical protein
MRHRFCATRPKSKHLCSAVAVDEVRLAHVGAGHKCDVIRDLLSGSAWERFPSVRPCALQLLRNASTFIILLLTFAVHRARIMIGGLRYEPFTFMDAHVFSAYSRSSHHCFSCAVLMHILVCMHRGPLHFVRTCNTHTCKHTHNTHIAPASLASVMASNIACPL